MRTSFQHGTLVHVKRKYDSCWRFRWRENGVQRSEFVGSIKQYPTRAMAEKAATRYRKLANSNVEVVTISDLIEKFWKEAAPERETTAHSYRSIFKRIEAEYGSLRVDSFCSKVLEIEAWLKGLKIIGRHPKKGPAKLVSPLYRGQVKNLMHLLIEKAMLWNHAQVERNPIDLIRLKGSARAKELVIVSTEQYQQLLDDPLLPELVKTMVQLAAGLGLRVSEILGLRWADADFEAKTIQIQRSVVHGKANETKTASSATKLPLHDNLIEVLRTWKAHETFKSKWVFCSERTERPYDRDWLRSEYLQPAGERIGMPGLGWHSFRHSYRAMQRSLGIDMETQRSLMRHARIRTTIDTYGGDDTLAQTRPANDKIVEMLSRRSA